MMIPVVILIVMITIMILIVMVVMMMAMMMTMAFKDGLDFERKRISVGGILDKYTGQFY